MMERLVLASNNPHKIEEMNQVIGSSFLLKGLADIECFEELPETQETIEGNALQKAQYVFDNYNYVCFSDDSGLEVEALNGNPGVHSAYYAGPQRNADDNIKKLLKNLDGVQNRNAQFRTVIALVEASGYKLFEGIISGEILLERRGVGGFGYDPIFKPYGHTKTFAEMSIEEKNKISHRAIAIHKLAEYLQSV